MVLDAVALSDLQIICVSSVCCDLRFYDAPSASKCNLRLYVKNFPSPLRSLYYHQPSTDDKNAKLIVGDMAGSVRVLILAKNFKRKLRDGGTVIKQISFRDLMKVRRRRGRLMDCMTSGFSFFQGEYQTMDCKEFINIHNDVVRQVFFSESLNSFISASESTITKSAYLPSVIIGNLSSQDARIVFTMNSVSEPDEILQFHFKNFSSHPLR